MSTTIKPLRLAVIFGGRSAEHEVSLASARAVVQHLDRKRYDVQIVGITRDGTWLTAKQSAQYLEGRREAGQGGSPQPYLPPGVDCVFPALHGPGGEDGSLQGWLELLGVPFVGSGSIASGAAMDKALAKHVLRSLGIPVVSWTDVRRDQFHAAAEEVLDQVIHARGLPCFIKPACLGSSVGMTRATTRSELQRGLEFAFEYDADVLVEPALDARELEIAVLDGRPRLVVGPAEIKPKSWYDYEAKYCNDSAELLVPAPDLPPSLVTHLQEMAEAAFVGLRLKGMARIDFFLGNRSGRPVLNEVNTLPGFTAISMFPKLLEHTGLSFGKVCDRLIDLAMAEHKQRQALRCDMPEAALPAS